MQKRSAPDAMTTTKDGAAAQSALTPPLRSRLADNPRLRPIVMKFGARLEQQMLEFERAHAEGNLCELAQLAHWLRGAAGTVGFVEFTQPSLSLEKAAKCGDATAAASAFAEIRALAARVERVERPQASEARALASNTAAA